MTGRLMSLAVFAAVLSPATARAQTCETGIPLGCVANSLSGTPPVYTCDTNSMPGPGVCVGPGTSFLSQENSTTYVAGTYSIEGTSVNNTGIYGWTTNGTSVRSVYGVQGYAQNNGVGVNGTSATGVGVSGLSGGGVAPSSSYGMYASSDNGDAFHAYYNGTGGASAVTGSVSGTGNGVVGAASSASYYGVYGYNNTANGVGVNGTAPGSGGVGVSGGSTGGVGVFGSTSAATWPGLWGTSFSTASTAVGVHGSTLAGSGIGVSGTSATGDGMLGLTSGATNPGVTAGVVGAGTGSGVYGVWGASTNTDGVVGEDSSNGNGVYGSSAGTGSGVHGYSVSGEGVYGLGNASGMAGVYGTTQASSGGYGVYGLAGGASSTGVYGSGAAYGVYASTTTGTAGVYGVSTSTGLTSGVFGQSPFYGVNGNSTGTGGIGVLAQCSGSGCWALQTEENVNIANSASLYFNGSCYHGPCTSDRRLKKDIESLGGALDRLGRLRPVTYNWKNPEDQGNQTGTQTGFIAQEVEEVFPEWIGENKQGFKTLDIRPTQITALEVAAIQTLNDKNKALEAQVKRLTSHLEDLENGAHPIAASFTSGLGISPGNLGLALLTMLGAFAVSRRKEEKKS